MDSKKISVFTGAFIYLILCTAVFADSQPVTQIDLIFDASGSMKARAGGKPKIATAKKAMYKIIDELAKKENLQMALRVYGQKSMKCTDSVLVIPMGRIDAGTFKAKIRAIKPKGRTPIAYSLKKSVRDFKRGIPGDKIIILVTDGLESCMGNPCRTAAILKKGGIVTKIHVVAFGMKKKSTRTLKCVPAASGGMLITANNLGELTRAFDRIIKDTLKYNLELSAKDDTGNFMVVEYAIYNSNDQSKKMVASGDTSLGHKALLNIQPGTYDIMLKNQVTGVEIWYKNVTVTPDRKVRRTAVFAERKIEIRINDPSGKNLYGTVYIYDKTGKEIKMADNSLSRRALFKVLPGIYDIKVVDQNSKKVIWIRDVDLSAKTEFKKTVIVK